MPTPHSSLSSKVTKGYWVAVRALLQKRHGFSPATSQQAVVAYREALVKIGVGDGIYHAPIEETAQGIVNRGYITVGESAKPRHRAKRPHVTAS